MEKRKSIGGLVVLLCVLLVYVCYAKTLNSAEVWLEKGNEAFDAGNHQEAITHYSKAIELNTQYMEAYGNRGLANLKLGDYYNAVGDCSKAIGLNPMDAIFHIGNGIFKITLGQKLAGNLDLSEMGKAAYNNTFEALSKGGKKI